MVIHKVRVFQIAHNPLEEDSFTASLRSAVDPWLEDLKQTFQIDDTGYLEMLPTPVNSSPDILSIKVTFRATVEHNQCHNCGEKIGVAIFKGGDFCSDLCRKALAEEPVRV